jgi:hypothetical protein
MDELFHCALFDARMIGNSMIMMAKDALLISPIFEDGKKKGKKLDLGNCNHFDDKDGIHLLFIWSHYS